MNLRILYEDDTEEEFKQILDFYYIVESKTLNIMFYGKKDWIKKSGEHIKVISVNEYDKGG